MGEIKKQETTGEDQPTGYSMCALSSLSNAKMILFGGSTKTQQMSQDAYCLDTKTWVWSKLINVGDEEGIIPPPIASCCAASIMGQSGNQVLIFGGASIGSEGYEGGMGLIPQDEAWVLTVDTDNNIAQWSKIDCQAKPPGRVAASLSPIDRSFLLQGGFDPKSRSTFDVSWLLKP